MTTPTPKSHGRTGRPWARIRTQVIAEETHCHLCHQPVNKNLPGTHPAGPTVDHIIPLSKAPQLAHDRNNLRLAHQACNASKGTKPPPRATQQTTPLGNQSEHW